MMNGCIPWEQPPPPPSNTADLKWAQPLHLSFTDFLFKTLSLSHFLHLITNLLLFFISASTSASRCLCLMFFAWSDLIMLLKLRYTARARAQQTRARAHTNNYPQTQITQTRTFNLSSIFIHPGPVFSSTSTSSVVKPLKNVKFTLLDDIVYFSH